MGRGCDGQRNGGRALVVSELRCQRCWNCYASRHLLQLAVGLGRDHRISRAHRLALNLSHECLVLTSVYVGPAVVEELKRIVRESEITK